MIYFNISKFILGTILLYYSSNVLIDSSSSLAKKYNISKIIIGMTLIAFGTSLPELLVSIMASFRGEIDLVVGNVLGSNIANIGLVMGITGLLYTISCEFKTIKFDSFFLFITSISFSCILYYSKFENLYAILLLILFSLYMCIFLKSTNVDNNNVYENHINQSNLKLSILITGSIIGLSLGSHFLIDGAINIAKYFNISSMVIGITAVALGTSLPELATSLNAAKKKEIGLFLGNIFGSNIINIVFVFGLSLLINTNEPQINNYDNELLFFISLTFILIVSLFFGKIHRSISAFFLITYIYFIAYTFSIL